MMQVVQGTGYNGCAVYVYSTDGEEDINIEFTVGI
jgi:hypothetical protein